MGFSNFVIFINVEKILAHVKVNFYYYYQKIYRVTWGFSCTRPEIHRRTDTEIDLIYIILEIYDYL